MAPDLEDTGQEMAIREPWGMGLYPPLLDQAGKELTGPLSGDPYSCSKSILGGLHAGAEEVAVAGAVEPADEVPQEVPAGITPKVRGPLRQCPEDAADDVV